MREFTDIEAVEDWLEPMDYPGFWYAVEPYELTLQDRDHCDNQINEGGVSSDTVLFVLKGLARMELLEKFQLKHRRLTPWVKLVEAH